MVQLGILLAREDPRLHRPVGEHIVDGVVDGAFRIISLKAAEGQIVVPREHGELAVLLVEIVVVDHRARVAVAVHDEIVDDEIAQHRVHVQNVLQVLIRRELLEARYQPLFVLAGHIGLRVVENIRIAVRIIVDVLQLHIV